MAAKRRLACAIVRADENLGPPVVTGLSGCKKRSQPRELAAGDNAKS
jgi:hypothetical protein